MDKLADPILQVLSDYKAAVYARDVDAFVSLYDPNLVVYDMWRVWKYDGIASWRQMTEGWFGALGEDRVVVDFSDVHTVVGDDVAVVHAFVNFRAVSGDGVDLRAFDNRLSAALKRTGESWKIVHQHTSGPIDPANATVIFNRE
ncbi:MAG TPA: nuclear transport factor 2 family protein [Paraburkholderia sp.]|nr:nuclear transport factor 2 family protein [Paraburkholderia sp.]